MWNFEELAEVYCLTRRMGLAISEVMITTLAIKRF